MFSKAYQNTVIQKPRIVLTILLTVTVNNVVNSNKKLLTVWEILLKLLTILLNC